MGLLMKRWPVGAAVTLLLLWPVAARGEAPEYQVKAAMLYKFAVFVEWPATSFASGTSPFVACVIGKNPFGPWLQREMGEAGVGSHPVQIRHLEEGKGAAGCHLVFIAASETPRLEELLANLQNGTALIVSDVNEATRFCHLGGMISLTMQGSKVRFQLNSTAVEKAGLKVDSKLKRVALSARCGERR